MILRICDVEHGACALLLHRLNGQLCRLAMIDCGDAADFRPSHYIATVLNRRHVDYFFVTNADQDHLSDLNGLWESSISIGTAFYNPHPRPDILRRIKEESGDVSNDIERYLYIRETYKAPVTEPFNLYMGGITETTYCNSYPEFDDTNNLSLAVFIQYGDFKILFPGDLEEEGWRTLLRRPDFRAELSGLTILVASHHGRESGYCADVFNYCAPRAIVMSDKAIVHDTQLMSRTYGEKWRRFLRQFSRSG
jgi:beta-lactamase superfamily II metal-dependent hydrolase